MSASKWVGSKPTGMSKKQIKQLEDNMMTAAMKESMKTTAASQEKNEQSENRSALEPRKKPVPRRRTLKSNLLPNASRRAEIKQAANNMGMSVQNYLEFLDEKALANAIEASKPKQSHKKPVPRKSTRKANTNAARRAEIEEQNEKYLKKMELKNAAEASKPKLSPEDKKPKNGISLNNYVAMLNRSREARMGDLLIQLGQRSKTDIHTSFLEEMQQLNHQLPLHMFRIGIFLNELIKIETMRDRLKNINVKNGAFRLIEPLMLLSKKYKFKMKEQMGIPIQDEKYASLETDLTATINEQYKQLYELSRPHIAEYESNQAA